MARRTDTRQDGKEPRRVGRADDLYGLPLEQFTAARDRLAKSLREQGDPDAATQVKALRKPNTTVWAVNQVARRDPRRIARFLKAAERLRAAHRGDLGPRGAEGLRAASEELRSQIAELVAAAEDVLEEAGARADLKASEAVREILQAAPTAPDRELRLLERGTLTEPLRPAAFSEVLAMMRGGARGQLRLLPSPKDRREEEKREARRAAEEERAQRLSAERERALARGAARRAREDEEKEAERQAARRAAEAERQAARRAREAERQVARRANEEERQAAEEERGQRAAAEREKARQAEAKRARDEARRAAERGGKLAERAAVTARRVVDAAERAEEAARRAREQADAAEEAAEEARARAAEVEQRLAEAEAALAEPPVRATASRGRRR